MFCIILQREQYNLRLQFTFELQKQQQYYVRGNEIIDMSFMGDHT